MTVAFTSGFQHQKYLFSGFETIIINQNSLMYITWFGLLHSTSKYGKSSTVSQPKQCNR